MLIDDAFLPEEKLGIHDGLDRWEAALPEIDFTRLVVPQNELFIKALRRYDEDTIYFIRAVGYADPACINRGLRSDNNVGITYIFAGNAVVCVDAQYLDGPAAEQLGLELAWRRVTMHEIGHALGLDGGGVDGMGHLPPPAVMAIGFYTQSDDIQCADKQAMEARWGLPERC